MSQAGRDYIARRTIVDENGCWRWQGASNGNGYGRMRVGGVGWLPHRFSYTVHVGEIPAGLDLDHLCRVTDCCNPAHLEPVTHAVNIRRGNTNTVEDDRIEAIRADHSTGNWSQRQLARRHGCAASTVARYTKGT